MTHQHLPHSRRKGVDKVWPSYASAESRLAKIVFREHLKRSIPPMSRRRKYRLCSVFAASRVGRTTTIYPQSIAVSKPEQKNRALRHGLSEAGRLTRRFWYAKPSATQIHKGSSRSDCCRRTPSSASTSLALASAGPFPSSRHRRPSLLSPPLEEANQGKTASHVPDPWPSLAAET